MVLATALPIHFSIHNVCQALQITLHKYSEDIYYKICASEDGKATNSSKNFELNVSHYKRNCSKIIDGVHASDKL